MINSADDYLKGMTTWIIIPMNMYFYSLWPFASNEAINKTHVEASFFKQYILWSVCLMTRQNHTKSIPDNKITILIPTLINKMNGLQDSTSS